MERLDAIGEPEVRAALLYVRGSDRAVTADDAALALGVHRSVARARLERLARVGLLETTLARRSGRSGPGAGRPAKLYAPAPESELLEFPPRHFPALVARLLDAVPVEGRQDALRRAGEDYGRKLANVAAVHPKLRVADGLEGVCSAVRSLGFQANLEELNGHTAVIGTPTCPLRPLVAERADAAEIDRGMWAGLIEQGVRGVRARAVECETHSCLERRESCKVVVHLRHLRSRRLVS